MEAPDCGFGPVRDHRRLSDHLARTRTKLSITIVNRGPTSPDTVEVRIRDSSFTGAARVRTLTGDENPASRPAPDIEGARMEESSPAPRGDTVLVEVPPRSFTVVEAPIAVR